MGNFVLIYELLDELIDFGYPQHTGPEVLKLYVTQKGLKSEQKKQAEIKKRLGDITGAISWRAQDIKYRRNEIFIDVLEKVNVLYSPKGTLLESDVSGSIMIKAYLSGMPECRFGMNDKLLLDKEQAASGIARKRKNAIQLDDVSFHQCVKLNKFDTDRVVSFVPPDGEFELMKYRSTENLVLPFRLLPNVRETVGVRVDFSVSIKALFDGSSRPPACCSRCRARPTPPPPNQGHHRQGQVRRSRKRDRLENLALPGGAEHMINGRGRPPRDHQQKGLVAAADLARIHCADAHVAGEFPPGSTIGDRFLKVLEPKLQYNTTKWIRYSSSNGRFEHRLHRKMM
jgi:AP-2 complex subunit mu-1